MEVGKLSKGMVVRLTEEACERYGETQPAHILIMGFRFRTGYKIPFVIGHDGLFYKPSDVESLCYYPSGLREKLQAEAEVAHAA